MTTSTRENLFIVFSLFFFFSFMSVCALGSFFSFLHGSALTPLRLYNDQEQCLLLSIFSSVHFS